METLNRKMKEARD